MSRAACWQRFPREMTEPRGPGTSAAGRRGGNASSHFTGFPRNSWSDRDVERRMSDAVLSRRGLLGLALAAGVTPMRASDSDFWNRKPPADWTPGEIDRLLRNSPWAKETIPSYTSQPPQTDYPPWSENPPVGGVPGLGPKSSAKAPYHAIVRWENAEPIREAQKIVLPAAFGCYHVLGVSFRLNVTRDIGPRPVEDLKQSAILLSTRAIGAELVQVHPAIKNGFLIAFPKTVTPGDRQLQFSARAGRLAFQVRFNTSDMRYHGQLAL